MGILLTIDNSTFSEVATQALVSRHRPQGVKSVTCG
jgi:hypothetical protein